MNVKPIHQILNKRPVIHTVFWLLFVLIGSFIFSYQQNYPYFFFLLNFVVHLPVYVLFTYAVVYQMVPRLLLSQKYWSFFGSLVLSICVAAFLRIAISRYVYFALFIPEVLHPKEWISPSIFLLNVIWIIGTAITFAMFKYYKNWMTSQALANEAERKHLASELQVLKAQLNPHFLFNTFNNLYVLSLQKSDKTPAAISKMSDLFHYILYECNSVEVPVSKEIKLIEDYIQLQGLRYADRLSINFEKDIENPEFMIPPMLLYTFIENCFKHGCSNDPGSPWIKLRIRARNNSFCFEAENSIPNAPQQKNKSEGGVGLANVKRRLELIYPGNHQLDIQKDDKLFYIRLELHKQKPK